MTLAAAALAPASAAPVTQCQGDETIVFSCSTGSRVLSICASKDLSKNAGYMQYRYGPPGKPELVYPEALRHPAGLFTPGTLSFSGGGGAYLKFAKPPYAYTVFSAIGNWGRKGKATVEGVAIANPPTTAQKVIPDRIPMTKALGIGRPTGAGTGAVVKPPGWKTSWRSGCSNHHGAMRAS